ncbi:hypothetical protein SpCBS45565_g04168 [Spizellomyces sp. 'palustris']|nr:hypothetical protein SpCBS45565_g04168 [Spizellomyces sp. 'palustris']
MVGRQFLVITVACLFSHLILPVKSVSFTNGSLDSGSVGGFWKYSEVVEGAKELASKFPQWVEYKSIGASIENRDIPALLITNKKDTTIPVERRPSVLFASTLRGDEPLSLAAVLHTIRHLTSDPQLDPIVPLILSTTKLWFVPIVNVDGWAAATPQSYVGKNLRITCENQAASGVDLSRNWGYMWDTYLPDRDLKQNTEEYEDNCLPFYHGTLPFSEPETDVLQRFIKKEKPASTIFFRQTVSEKPAIIIPYMFHPSNSSTQSNVLKMMRTEDAKVYSQLTGAMNDAVGKMYSVGSAWEVLKRTISGSEVDWTFDQAGSFAVMVQVAGDVAKDGMEKIVEKHLNATLTFANVARTLPAKSAKPGKSIVKHIQTAVYLLPMILGAVLALILLTGYMIARFLGYDKIWDRFVFFVHRLKRWRMYRNYRGLAPTGKYGDDEEVGGEEDGVDWGFELEGGEDEDGEDLGYRM